VSGDEPRADDAQAPGAARATAEPIGGEDRRSGGPRGRDDRALPNRERETRLAVVYDEQGRGARKTPPEFFRIARDPFEAGDADAVCEECGKRDDPAIRLLGKPQEVTVRVDRASGGVREIRVAHDIDAFGAVGADEIADGLPVDDRHFEL